MATFRELMDAAHRADAAGETQDARRLLELAREAQRGAAPAPAQTTDAPVSGPWQKYQAQGATGSGPWEKYQRQQTGAPTEPSTYTAEDFKAAARRAAAAGDNATARRLIDRAKATEEQQPAGPWEKYQSTPQTEERSLVETIMDGAEKVGGALGYASQEAARGVTQMLGAPVDLVNASPMLANALPGEQGFGPMSERPVGGSEWLWDTVSAPRDLVSVIMGGEPGDEAPENRTERIVGRTAQEIGAASVPVAGALGAAARTGVQGAREMAGPVGRFVESAAVAPRGFVAKEGAYAAGAGTGAGVARESVSDGDPTTTTRAEALADFGGALGGAGAVGLGSAARRAATDALGAMTGRGGSNVVRDAVAGELGNAAGAPLMSSGAADTSGLANALGGGGTVSDAVPGYRESAADVLQNPGLASLEYSRQSGANAGRYAARRQDNATAVSGAMEDAAPEATPGAFSSAAGQRRDEMIGDATAAVTDAQQRFDAAASNLQSTMSGETRGRTVRAALDEALGAARAVERDAWAAVGGEADVGPLAAEFRRIGDGLTSAQRETVRDTENLTRIPERLSTGAGDDENAQLIASVFGPDEAAEAAPVNLAEVTTLRSSLTDQVRAARTAGQPDRARILEQYVGAIDGFLQRSTPQQTSEALENARRVSFDLNERFTRPGDPVAEATRRVEGRPRLPDSEVAGRFIKSDQGQASNLDRLLTEAQGAEDVRPALRDQILSDVQARGLLERPDQLREYLGQYGHVFTRFPELRDELGTAAGLRQEVQGALGTLDDVQRRLGTRNGSTVARYLSFGDERARDAMASVVNAREPGKAADELLSFVGDDAQAVDGARAAFWDLMEGSSRSRGETTRNLSGDQPWRPQALHRFIHAPKNRAVLERLYRDQPEQLQRIDQIAEALRTVDARTTSKAPNSSGTPQAISGNSVLPSTETLGAYGFAYRRGQVGLPFIGLRLVSTMARRAILRGRGQQFQELLDEALLNPEVAAMLLREHNPANVDAMSRWAKGWAGARAPVFADLLEGEPADEAQTEDDEILEAIGR